MSILTAGYRYGESEHRYSEDMMLLLMVQVVTGVLQR